MALTDIIGTSEGISTHGFAALIRYYVRGSLTAGQAKTKLEGVIGRVLTSGEVADLGAVKTAIDNSFFTVDDLHDAFVLVEEGVLTRAEVLTALPLTLP